MVASLHPKPDYPKWLDAELWTILEAAYLLSDKEPILVDDPSEMGEPEAEIYRNIKHATENGNLTRQGKNRSGEVRGKKVRPDDVLTWALGKRHKIPKALQTAWDERKKRKEDASADRLKAEPQQISEQKKDWEVHNTNDPEPVQPWYTAARYFARRHVIENPSLLTKRDVLAQKVACSLSNAGIMKRGGKSSLSPATVKKAFSNIALG